MCLILTQTVRLYLAFAPMKKKFSLEILSLAKSSSLVNDE